MVHNFSEVYVIYESLHMMDVDSHDRRVEGDHFYDYDDEHPQKTMICGSEDQSISLPVSVPAGYP